jgi:hypothetical protein
MVIRAGMRRERRYRHFVGRAAELAVMQGALASGTLTFQTLYVYGPGGIGKTALLHQLTDLCVQKGVAAAYLDARHIEPAPQSFVRAVLDAVGLAAVGASVEALSALQDRRVILIDTYESLGALDTWVRDVFLPQLPDTMMVVLAGRAAPSVEWRGDPGWQTIIRPLALRNLTPEESRAFLASREIPAADVPAILDFTHGHPLALSLVADTFALRPGLHFEPQAAPEVVHALVERFVEQVPGPAHRAAVEACALVRAMTESLLAAMLRIPDAHDLFRWLRELSFIDSGPLGLFPHDLAREALAADVRWRNPEWYGELHGRAREFYKQRMQQTRDEEQRRVLIDYVYLHRLNPVIRAAVDWHDPGGIWQDVLRAEDETEIVAMVRRHEGPAAAEAAAHWLHHPAATTVVFRGGRQQPEGFLLSIAIESLSDADAAPDAITGAVRRYLRARAPLRPGERAILFRFWMSAERHQEFAPVQSRIFTNVFQSFFNTPRLAVSFFPAGESELLEILMGYAEFVPPPELSFEQEGRRYFTFVHDWRVMPLGEWLDILGQKEVGITPPAPTPTEEPLVLSEDGFADAVRSALAALRGRAPGALGGHPLLRSRLVRDRVGSSGGESPREEELRRLLQEGIEALRPLPKGERLYGVMYHTFLTPAPSQEKAAELVDLPFSTYRRYLAIGIQRVTEMLWRREIGDLIPS